MTPRGIFYKMSPKRPPLPRTNPVISEPVQCRVKFGSVILFPLSYPIALLYFPAKIYKVSWTFRIKNTY